jgi:hypothetical protein
VFKNKFKLKNKRNKNIINLLMKMKIKVSKCLSNKKWINQLRKQRVLKRINK